MSWRDKLLDFLNPGRNDVDLAMVTHHMRITQTGTEYRNLEGDNCDCARCRKIRADKQPTESTGEPS